MKKLFVFCLLLAALMLTACAGAASASGLLSTGENSMEVSGAAVDSTPEAVVREFYAEYLDYIGRDDTSGEFRNPLVDRAYREMSGLHPQFVQHIDTLLDGGFRADPFLCAQDIPQFVSVVSVEREGDRALVLLEDSFPGHQVEVTVDLVDGQWLITGINSGN
jgi:hypothetical protein